MGVVNGGTCLWAIIIGVLMAVDNGVDWCWWISWLGIFIGGGWIMVVVDLAVVVA